MLQSTLGFFIKKLLVYNPESFRTCTLWVGWGRGAVFFFLINNLQPKTIYIYLDR